LSRAGGFIPLPITELKGEVAMFPVRVLRTFDAIRLPLPGFSIETSSDRKSFRVDQILMYEGGGLDWTKFEFEGREFQCSRDDFDASIEFLHPSGS
jgi:hypothetical protein